MIKVVAFAGPLTDAGEDGIATMRLRDVVDQFHDDDGLANAGAAEQTDFAAFRIRRQQVDDLDAGNELLGFGRLVDEGRRVAVNRQFRRCLNRSAFVDRFADDVEDAAERLRSHRHHDRRTGIADFLAANETFGRVHRDAADGVLAEMLGHFQDQPIALVVHRQGIQNRRQIALEMDVDNRAQDLRYLAY